MSTNFAEPSDLVDDKKQRNLIQAADTYIELNNYEREILFHMVSLYLESNRVELIKMLFGATKLI